ncbi:MAG: Crp/Fnr family transcriptional regulator [Chloroflexi bacterium]|nr:Crp/Fnr family transcriptional regulator [Chloroflexota bacterium]
MAGAQFLRNVSLFANLSFSELEPLAQRLVSRKYAADEQVLSQGSPGNSMYIVESGLVEIVVRTVDGQTQSLAHFGPGQVFGEFALLDGLPRSAGAIAREPSVLLVLTRPEFFMYLEQHPAVAINLLVLLSRRLRFTLQRTEADLDPTPIEVQIAAVLTRLAERYGEPRDGRIQLSIRLTQGELAGIMGRPRSETEAALDSLRRQGLVETRGLQMMIHDLDQLRTIAAGPA